ncbi:response regulator [Streptomyces sp. NPDC094438]
MVVDDDAIVRRGLRTILESAPDIEVLAEAADGQAGVEQARRLMPDVIFMDIRMPRLDGLAATREICALPVAVPPRVVMLTTFGLDEYVAEALRSGAVGFLLKDSAPTELLEAVRIVMDGNALLSPAVTRRLITAFADRVPSITHDQQARLGELTARETKVLTLLAQGLSNTEIGARMFLGEGTVKGHVSRILSKLGAANRVQAAIFAHNAGLATGTS